MSKTIARLSDLAPDKRNANRGTKRGSAALENSIHELGAGRSILADKDGNVIAGNKTLEAFKRAGKKKIRVIETTGDELVVVQRTDLNLETDVKAKELAIADNRVGELSLEWDPDILRALDQEVDLSTMFDPGELANLIGNPDPANSVADEYVGMPDFESTEELDGPRVIVHFKAESDREAFEKLVGQKIGKLRSIWYPELPHTPMASLAYKNPGDAHATPVPDLHPVP